MTEATCACAMFQSLGRCWHLRTEDHKPLEAPVLTDVQRKEFEEKKRLLSMRRRPVPEAITRMHAWNAECDARYGPVDG